MTHTGATAHDDPATGHRRRVIALTTCYHFCLLLQAKITTTNDGKK
jgi:hypothetical protein